MIPVCCVAHGLTSVEEHTTHVQLVFRVCPACVWRWSSALCAWLASFWRVHSCVEFRAQFCACTKIPTHTSNDDECTALVQRARRTSIAHGDAHPANDDPLAKIATFSVRAGRASCRCDWRFIKRDSRRFEQDFALVPSLCLIGP